MISEVIVLVVIGVMTVVDVKYVESVIECISKVDDYCEDFVLWCIILIVLNIVVWQSVRCV